MGKRILLSAALLAFSLTAGVSANWITGNPTVLAVSHGEAAFQTALSNDQRLAVNLRAEDTAAADIVFSTQASSSVLTLSSLPVSVSSDDNQDAQVRITPLVNDGNGFRFYLVETGNGSGSSIVSYKRGNFASAFIPSDAEDADASFEVTKKEVLFHVTREGNTDTYGLVLNAKDGTFTAQKK